MLKERLVEATGSTRIAVQARLSDLYLSWNLLPMIYHLYSITALYQLSMLVDLGFGHLKS